MKFFTYTKSLAAVGFLAVSGLASASTLTYTQIVTIPAASTDITSAPALLNLFGSIGAPGGSVLTGVSLSMTITETLTSLTLTNSTTVTQNARYTDSANFDAGDSANATDATTLDDNLNNSEIQGDPAGTVYKSSLLNFTANQTYTSSAFPLPAILTETTSATGTTASYTGAGTFNLNFSTFSGYGFVGSNNINSTQSTVAAATASVTYTYNTPSGTPEPSTFVLLGGALVALGSLRNRKKSAKV